MTALQLSMMLSGLDTNEIIIKLFNKQYTINGIEVGIDENEGKVFITVEE